MYMRAILLLISVLGFSFSTKAQQDEFKINNAVRTDFARMIKDSGHLEGPVFKGRSKQKNQNFVEGLSEFVPMAGPIVRKVSLIENGQEVTKFWSELEVEQWKQALQNIFIDTVVYTKSTDSSFSLAPVSATATKGSFLLRYHNFIYRPYYCSADNPNAGQLYVGVGLRVNVEANFKKTGINASFSGIALGASSNKVQGQITAEVIGLSGSSTLQNVLADAQGGISYESMIEAGKTYSVAGQMIEDLVAVTEPQIFGYRDGLTVGSCYAALTARDSE